MDDDSNDIESYWEGLRPKQDPKPKRDLSRYAKQVRDLTQDEKASLIETVSIEDHHRARSLFGFRELTEDERAALIRAQPPIEDQQDRSFRDPSIRNIPPWHPDYRATSNFIDPSVRLEATQRILREAAQTPDPMSEEEGEESRNPMRMFGGTPLSMNERIPFLIRNFCTNEERRTVLRALEEGFNHSQPIQVGILNQNFANNITSVHPEYQEILNLWYRSTGPYSRASTPDSILSVLQTRIEDEDGERVIPFDELDQEVSRRRSNNFVREWNDSVRMDEIRRGYRPDVSMGTSVEEAAAAYQAGREEALRILREELGREPNVQEINDAYLIHDPMGLLFDQSRQAQDREEGPAAGPDLSLEEDQMVESLIREAPSIEPVRAQLLESLSREPTFRELAENFVRLGGNFQQLDREIHQLRDRIPLEDRRETQSTNYEPEPSLITILQDLRTELDREPSSRELRNAYLAEGGSADIFNREIRRVRFPVDTQAEYDHLATAAGIPPGSITVGRVTPDEIDRIFSDPTTLYTERTLTESPLEVINRNLLERLGREPTVGELSDEYNAGQMIMGPNESIEDFTNRVSQVRGSYSFTPRGDNNQSEGNPLSRLNDALAALGFPPSNISIESSQTEGTRLTINMSPSIEFETDSSPDEVSVTLSHRR